MNRPAARFFGLGTDEAKGRPLFEDLLLPLEGQPPPGPESGLESRIFRAKLKSGRPAFVVLTTIPRHDSDDWLFVACDITDQFLDHGDLANKRAVFLMLSSITSRLLETDLGSLSENVSEALRTLGLFLGMSCAYLCRLRPGQGPAELVGGWWHDPATELDGEGLNRLLDGLPDFLALLGQMRAIHQTVVDAGSPQPHRAGGEYLRLRKAGAMIALPLVLEDSLLGFLACERRDDDQGWPPDEVMMLRTIAEAMSLSLARLDVEQRLFEQTQYLTLLLDTLQTGVVVSNARDQTILGINKHAQELIGASRDEVVGSPRWRFLAKASTADGRGRETAADLESSEWQLNTASGASLKVLRTAAKAGHDLSGYLVECFSDITALKNLMENQSLDIGLAKRLLGLVEGAAPRNLRLSGGVGLFFSPIALSCMDEGGDHYFVRELPPSPGHEQGRVIVSLKDQSGHRVGCVLRSIITDILHQHLLSLAPDEAPEAIVGRLNDLLCHHRLLGGDDFLTAVVCQIDKADHRLRFVSCGHPGFVHVRSEQVTLCPGHPGAPGSNLLLGALPGREFKAAEMGLEPGDRLILYTDGLLEAAGNNGARGRAFRAQDLARLTADLVRSRPGLGVEDMMRRILEEVSRRGGRAVDAGGVNRSGDDVTLVGLETESLVWTGEEVWRPMDLEHLQGLMTGYFRAREAEWARLGFEKPLRLKLCLEEMAANAFKHGNRRAPGAAITLRHRYGNDFHLQVTDGGSGFDWTAYSDTPRLDDPRGESGRGIFLLKLHAGHLTWNRAGNQVSLTLSRREPTGRFASHRLPILWQ